MLSTRVNRRKSDKYTLDTFLNDVVDTFRGNRGITTATIGSLLFISLVGSTCGPRTTSMSEERPAAAKKVDVNYGQDVVYRDALGIPRYAILRGVPCEVVSQQVKDGQGENELYDSAAYFALAKRIGDIRVLTDYIKDLNGLGHKQLQTGQTYYGLRAMPTNDPNRVYGLALGMTKGNVSSSPRKPNYQF